MSKNAVVLGCFGLCGVAIAVAAGTATPVAYGAGELTPGVGITSIVSTLIALVSGAEGLFALLRSDAAKDMARSVIGNIQQADTHGVGVDAAFVAIATALILKKKAIGPELLSQLADLRNKVQTELDTK